MADISVPGERERLRESARRAGEADALAVVERIGVDAAAELAYSLQTAEFASCVADEEVVGQVFAQVFFDMEVVAVDGDATVLVHDIVGPPDVLPRAVTECLFDSRDGFRFHVETAPDWQSGRFWWSTSVPLPRSPGS